MKIACAEIPAPLCYVHISRFSCTDTQTVTDILNVFVQTEIVRLVAKLYADIVFSCIVEIAVAGNKYFFRLVLVPFCLYTLQRPVPIKKAFRYRKVNGVKLVLVSCAER